METAALDNMIRRLLMEGSNGKQVKLSEAEVRRLCVESGKVFLSQPSLLRLSAPIKICGDIHGQFQDLLSIFRRSGYPPDSTYLFLGNYVDHGEQSLDTICLLLAYKVRYPDRVFLLRGNHEDASTNRLHGFYDDCKRKYNIRVWKTFTECFDCLPFAALVEERIFCIHGGLSPELNGPEQLEDIRRPTGIPDYGFLHDLLWSELDSNIVGWDSSERGVSSSFGPDKVVEFLEKNDLHLICRAHHVVEDGYEFFAERKLVTIFSAINYRGEFNNAGALLVVDETLMCSFEIFGPQARISEKSIEKPSNMISSKEVKFVKVEKPRNMIVSREKQAVHSLHESSEGHDDQILDEFMGIDLSDFSTWESPKEALVVADHGSSARPGSGEAAYKDALKQLRILRTADFSSSVPVAAIHDCLVTITKTLEFRDLSHGRATALRNLQSDLLPVASKLFNHCQAMKPLKKTMEAVEQQSTEWNRKKELLQERTESLRHKKEEYVASDLELNRLRAELARLEEENAKLKASVDRDLCSVRVINSEVVVGFTELRKAKAALPTYKKQLAEEETAVEEHSRRLSRLFDEVEDL